MSASACKPRQTHSASQSDRSWGIAPARPAPSAVRHDLRTSRRPRLASPEARSRLPGRAPLRSERASQAVERNLGATGGSVHAHAGHAHNNKTSVPSSGARWVLDARRANRPDLGSATGQRTTGNDGIQGHGWEAELAQPSRFVDTLGHAPGVLAMQEVEGSSPFIRLAFTAFLASGGHGRAPIVPQTTTQTLWLVGSLAAPLPCVAPCGADSDGAGVD